MALTTYSHVAPRLRISTDILSRPPVPAWHDMGRNMSLCEQSEFPVVKVMNQKCYQLTKVEGMLDVYTAHCQFIKFLS